MTYDIYELEYYEVYICVSVCESSEYVRMCEMNVNVCI